MKMSRYIIFFMLLILVSINLTGEFWIKHLDAGDRDILYEAGSGTFLSLRPELTVFDIGGKIFRQGIFKRGNNEWIELQETIPLDDGSFFSLAYSYGRDNIIEDNYKIIRFSWMGDVFFVKKLTINTRLFQLGQLLHVGGKIKILGYEDPGNLIGNVIVLNFTKDGELLNFRRIGLNIKIGRFYASDSALIQSDPDSYVIIKSGEIRAGSDLYKGFHLLKFTSDDILETANSFYVPDTAGGYFETPVIREDSDEGFVLLMIERQNDNGKTTRIPHLIKFDRDWQIKWSKKYQAANPVTWGKGCRLLLDGDRYTIALSKSLTIEDESLSNPVLIRTDRQGNVAWSKKYEYGGPLGVFAILNINNGGMLMSAHNRYFYMLDSKGEIPGNCYKVQAISIAGSDRLFIEEPVEAGRVVTDFIPASTVDYSGSFYDYDISKTNDPETFCSYPTLQGEFDSVIERSRFSGYYVHRIRFSVDSAISSYVSKFLVYRKYSEPGSDYEFISEVVNIAGQNDYEIEFRPFVEGKSVYSYKIVAYNRNNEVVDYAFLK